MGDSNIVGRLHTLTVDIAGLQEITGTKYAELDDCTQDH